MDLTLLVLAAGMGSRYGGLKQLDPIGPSGETIIDYSVFDAHRAGFTKVVFVIRKDFEEEFKEKVSSKYRNVMKVDHVYQDLNDIPGDFKVLEDRTKPWGTGQAVYSARELVKEPFAVINADDFYGESSFKVLASYLRELDSDDISRQCMVGYRLKNTLSENGSVSRGVCIVDNDDNLQSVTERTKIYKKDQGIVYEENNNEFKVDGDTVVSMNMIGFTPAIFSLITKDFEAFLKENIQTLKGEFYIPSVINNLIQRNKGTVKVLTSESKWFGVTYLEDKPVVQQSILELVENGDYPKDLWQ